MSHNTNTTHQHIKPPIDKVLLNIIKLPLEIIVKILWHCDIETLAFGLLPTFAENPHLGIPVWDPKLQFAHRAQSYGPACLDMRMVLACYEFGELINICKKNTINHNKILTMHVYYTRILPKMSAIIIDIAQDTTILDKVEKYREIYELWNESNCSNKEYEEQLNDVQCDIEGDLFSAWWVARYFIDIIRNITPLITRECGQRLLLYSPFIYNNVSYKFLIIIAHIIRKCIYSLQYKRDILPNIDLDTLKLAYAILDAHQDPDAMRYTCKLQISVNPYRDKLDMDRYSLEQKRQHSIWEFLG